MLAPHELKNKAFSKAVRGYNTSEVDDHIEFLIEKYTELYRENAELNRKLGLISAKLEEIQDKEASIRTALVEAQKKSDEIVKEAEDKAEQAYYNGNACWRDSEMEVLQTSPVRERGDAR